MLLELYDVVHCSIDCTRTRNITTVPEDGKEKPIAVITIVFFY